MATSAAPAAAAAAPVTLTKVFVGNLSFKTREAELAQAFSGAGKVMNANIITRGPRSLGYGFVEFGSDAEAKKAVELLNKKELDGREINVEVAKPREDGGVEGPKASGAPRRGSNAAGGPTGGGGGQRGPRGGQQGGQAAAGGAPANNGGGGGRRNQAAQAGGAPAPAAGGPGGQQRSGDYIPRRRPGFRGGRGGQAGGGRQGGAPAAGGAAAGGGAGAGAQNQAPRSSSATTLFVANLPFLVDDKGLEDLFKDFAPVSAHVVKKRNGKSKGFGFVELKNQEDQGKALNAMDKKEVQGRELIVKVALTEQVAKEQQAAAAAPAPGSPAPAAPKAASPATDKKQ